jgi:hypothetical protein
MPLSGNAFQDGVPLTGGMESADAPFLSPANIAPLQRVRQIVPVYSRFPRFEQINPRSDDGGFPFVGCRQGFSTRGAGGWRRP